MIIHVHIFLEVFQESDILKNAVSGRWCSDSRVLNVVPSVVFEIHSYHFKFKTLTFHNLERDM